MKTELKLAPEYNPPHAEIYADRVTEEVERVLSLLRSDTSFLTGLGEDGQIRVLRPEEVYLIRSEDERVFLYTEKERFRSRKRLYELENLTPRFLRISKSALVNLDTLESVEADFGGMFCLYLKNGLREYVSRRCLPSLRKYLGL